MHDSVECQCDSKGGLCWRRGCQPDAPEEDGETNENVWCTSDELGEFHFQVKSGNLFLLEVEVDKYEPYSVSACLVPGITTRFTALLCPKLGPGQMVIALVHNGLAGRCALEVINPEGTTLTPPIQASPSWTTSAKKVVKESSVDAAGGNVLQREGSSASRTGVSTPGHGANKLSKENSTSISAAIHKAMREASPRSIDAAGKKPTVIQESSTQSVRAAAVSHDDTREPESAWSTFKLEREASSASQSQPHVSNSGGHGANDASPAVPLVVDFIRLGKRVPGTYWVQVIHKTRAESEASLDSLAKSKSAGSRRASLSGDASAPGSAPAACLQNWITDVELEMELSEAVVHVFADGAPQRCFEIGVHGSLRLLAAHDALENWSVCLVNGLTNFVGPFREEDWYLFLLCDAVRRRMHLAAMGIWTANRQQFACSESRKKHKLVKDELVKLRDEGNALLRSTEKHLDSSDARTAAGELEKAVEMFGKAGVYSEAGPVFEEIGENMVDDCSKLWSTVSEVQEMLLAKARQVSHRCVWKHHLDSGSLAGHAAAMILASVLALTPRMLVPGPGRCPSTSRSLRPGSGITPDHRRQRVHQEGWAH